VAFTTAINGIQRAGLFFIGTPYLHLKS